jgi:hypothetical protein
MKKITLILLFAVVAVVSAQAQTEKGRFMLNVHNFSPLSTIITQEGRGLAPWTAFGIDFGTNKSEFGADEYKYNYVNFGLGASAHYFVANNLSIGGNLNFAHQRIEETEINGQEVEDGETFTTSQFILGPEVRYYYPLTSALKLYGRIFAGFGSLNLDEGTDPKIRQLEGGLGLAYFLHNNVSVNLGANYGTAYYNYENDNTEVTNNGFGLDVGFSLFFGGVNEE